MPVLPIIDLLIFLGWTTLAAGGILKAIYLATSYRPTLFSLAPLDLLLVALAFLGLALTLAARTWVRLNEPQLLARRRSAPELDDAFSGSRRSRERDRIDPTRAPEPAASSSGPGAASDLDPTGQWQRLR